MEDKPEKLRLFISVAVDEAVVGAIARFQRRLEEVVPPMAVRWVPAEQMHLTLKFLGGISSPELPKLTTALEPLGKNFRPIQLQAEGVSFFPNPRNARVIWVGLRGEVERLAQLQDQVEKASAPWAEKEETRGFKAHLTVGRVREPGGRKARELGQKLESVTAPHFGGWTVTEFRLMRSQLSPNGATHSVVADYPLGTKGTEGT
jgi:RNA 2',3'-cyclic 3'-phosphodiesterase